MTETHTVRLTVMHRPRLKLQVVAGPDTGKACELMDRVRIGTRGVADLVLVDPKVSGVHCEISADDLRVRDLGSKNGTFIKGTRIADAFLSAGESVTVGETQVRLMPLHGTVEVALHPADQFEGIVGSAPATRALMAKLERLAVSDATVLIEGETGTGKERIAEALHSASPRADRPLVVVDCASLPAGLIESELFGHERGAFTSAVSSTAGAFERANGGVVFLDEIGELPLELQPKLLRVLETRTVRRLGAERSVPVDVRIIAATHRDITVEVARGRFREDLYYRLAVVTLAVPPLRKRLEDLPLLAAHLLREMGADPAEFMTAESLAVLSTHDWPGNVRELRNTLERAIALMEPVQIVKTSVPPPPPSGPAMVVDVRLPLLVGRTRLVEEYERAYLTQLLHSCDGNVSEVARRAGIDRNSVHRMLRRLGLRGTKGGGAW